MPAPTIIFAPILLPCPIYLALQHGNHGTEHVISSLPYCSYAIRDTLKIEPGDPGIPKDAHATSFVAIGASTSRLDLPARGFKATSPFRARTLGTGSPGSNTIIVTLGISSILGIS
jgi:hypothetical protein